MKHIFLFLCGFLLSAPTAKADDFAQIAVQRITYIQAESNHLIAPVWSGFFTAYNGTHYDVTSFYESTRVHFNFKTALNIYNTPRLRLDVPMHFDNGYKATLQQTSRYMGLGIAAYGQLRRNLSASLHVFDLLQHGGKTREQPCYDDFSRAFHCGTGHAWTDVADVVNQRYIKPSVQMNLFYSF